MAHTPEVIVSDELFAPISPEVELCYQTFGDPSDEALLLVMGLGGPMNWWDTEFCELLARKGFHVIRYDNRDTGRSTKIDARVSRSDVVRTFTGISKRAPYSLSDMAADGVGLLDHLGIEAAHVAGISMGGMIVQSMAVEHPGRVRSVASIMSTTGKRTVGWQHPSLYTRLLAKRPVDLEGYLVSSVAMAAQIGSPAYPEDEAKALRRAEETWSRGLNGPGVLRHMLAVITQPDRSSALRSVKAPAVVIHGMADKMVHVSGGRATSAAIPGSELLLIDGMGHDLPVELWEQVTDAIRRNADRAS